MIPLLVIEGPTASGKTAVAVEIAKRLNGEVVSADSMQIYKGMDIGTAKPKLQEMQGIPHHMLDICEIGDSFSVADYCRLAHSCIEDIHRRGKLPVMAGGTGLYINSVVNNIDFTEGNSDEDYRNYLTALAEKEGCERVHSMLCEIDDDSAKRIHPNDIRRVIRALEVYKVTGKTMTEYQREAASRPKRYNAVKFALLWDRAVLYDRINRRVDMMISEGLLDEVKSLACHSFFESTASQAIGYKEPAAYFDGRLTYEEMLEEIKQGSRNYAKRQMSFFNADKSINWVNAEGENISSLSDKIVKIWRLLI